MPDNFFAFNRSTADGFRLGRGVESLKQAMDDLKHENDTHIQMINGDGSDPAHYNQHVTAYGYDSTADAKAATAELGTIVAKLNDNGSQSNLLAAINQFLARFNS